MFTFNWNKWTKKGFRMCFGAIQHKFLDMIKTLSLYAKYLINKVETRSQFRSV